MKFKQNWKAIFLSLKFAANIDALRYIYICYWPRLNLFSFAVFVNGDIITELQDPAGEKDSLVLMAIASSFLLRRNLSFIISHPGNKIHTSQWNQAFDLIRCQL